MTLKRSKTILIDTCMYFGNGVEKAGLPLVAHRYATVENGKTSD